MLVYQRVTILLRNTSQAWWWTACPPPPGSLHSFAAALRTSAKVEGFGPEGLEMPQLTKSKRFFCFTGSILTHLLNIHVYIYMYIYIYIHYYIIYIYISIYIYRISHGQFLIVHKTSHLFLWFWLFSKATTRGFNYPSSWLGMITFKQSDVHHPKYMCSEHIWPYVWCMSK